MTRSSFEYNAGKTITDEEYKIIEFVAKYHPSVDRAKEEKQLGELYKNYGMTLIKGMVFVANDVKKTEEKIKNLEDSTADCKKYLKDLKEGKFKVFIAE